MDCVVVRYELAKFWGVTSTILLAKANTCTDRQKLASTMVSVGSCFHQMNIETASVGS